MRYAGHKVLARSENGEWIEIQTDDGPAILRGYDPSLIEYETLQERQDEQAQKIRDEAGRRLVEATRATTLPEAISVAVTEFSETYEAGAPLPQKLKDLASIKNEMESLLYQVYTSAEPEGVWWP